MQNNHIISVIMPSLNVGPYIDECISSVRAQTMADIEILCIDAGSTDGTLEILENHAAADPRIRIINSPIKSYGYQVNIGISEARGEYIAIIETDDYISPSMMQRLYDMAKKYDLDYAKGNFEWFFSFKGHRRFFKSLMFPSGSDRYNKVICPTEDENLPNMDCSIWRGIYKTSFILENNIKCSETKGAAYQDLGFTMQVYDKAKKCAYIEDCLYFYQMERDGASSCRLEVLQFVEAEFKRLFENNLLSKNKAVYLRLIYAFVFETEKLLKKLDFQIDEEYIIKPYNWMKAQIVKALEEGIFAKNDLDATIWMKLKLLLENVGEYAKTLKKEFDHKQRLQCQIVEQLNGRSAIIFGSGTYGKKNLCELESLGITITSVCDSNPEKQGTTLWEYEIISPKQAHKLYPKSIFVIPDRPYKDEMIDQVDAVGGDWIIFTDLNTTK